MSDKKPGSVYNWMIKRRDIENSCTVNSPRFIDNRNVTNIAVVIWFLNRIDVLEDDFLKSNDLHARNIGDTAIRIFTKMGKTLDNG